MKLLNLTLAAVAAWGIASARTPPSGPPPLALCVPCEVVSVYDGDTASEVILSISAKVRYDNCWAPELNQPGGQESAANAKIAEGKKGRLLIPLDKANNLSDLFTFGRVVGEIWLDGQKESESQQQVMLGFATATKPSTK